MSEDNILMLSIEERRFLTINSFDPITMNGGAITLPKNFISEVEMRNVQNLSSRNKQKK